MNETTPPTSIEATGTGVAGRRPALRAGVRWLVLFTVLVLTGAAFFAAGRITAGLVPVSDSGADAGFARDMQAHHAQAVEMALITREKSTNAEIRAIAYDIVTTQQQQSGQMFAWLAEWGLPQAPSGPPMAWMGTGGQGGHGTGMNGMSHGPATGTVSGMSPTAGSGMDGMATPEQLQQLREATGPTAERLFTDLMIRHHQGGVAMARAATELARTARVRDFAASIVDAQTAEVTALRQLRTRL